MNSLTIPLLISALSLSTTVATAAPTSAQKIAALGQRLMLRCQTCHAVKANAPAKVGPNLNKIFGRTAGTSPGYTYSLAMRKSGVVWNEASFDTFLTKPSAMMPGTLMAFAGMPKKEERTALILWLKSNTK